MSNQKRLRRRRALLWGFSVAAALLTFASAAWACTGTVFGVSGTLEVCQPGTGPCLPATSGPKGTYRALGQLSNPEKPTSDVQVDIRYLTQDQFATNHNAGSRDLMPCMNPWSPSSLNGGAGLLLGSGMTNGPGHVFDFGFNLTGSDVKAQPSGSPILICAIEGGSGDAWTSNPVPFLLTS